MKKFIKGGLLCALAAALGLSLLGCGSGPKQEAASSAEEATLHFLANLQKGEFEMARTYLKEGNQLLHVFPSEAEDWEGIPELNDVYRQFCDKLSGLSYQVAEDKEGANGVVYITAQQYDFAASINEAMLAAMEKQCREGGDAFADYAAWMSQGIANAQMGEEDTHHAITTSTSDGYIIGHQGYSDQEFLNMVTGGFYDYADLQMAVCTTSMDSVEQTYYVLGLGDSVIAYMEEIAEKDETGELDDETIAGFNEFYAQMAAQNPGFYMGMHKDGDKVVMTTGLDMEVVDQKVLIEAGMVSGEFQGNMAGGYLSFAATIDSFEEAGITCTVTPVYEAEQ